jgi:hypothetical protein
MVSKLVLAVLGALLGVAPSNALAQPYKVAPAREIVNLRSGLHIDVMWASQAPMQNVILWPDNASTSQEFYFLNGSDSDDSITLMAVHSGQCLMLDWRGGYGNGTPVIQFPCQSSDYLPQRWHWRYVQCAPGQSCDYDQVKVLVNLAAHKCLDVGNAAGGIPPQGAYLQVWDCISDNGQWNAGNQLLTTAWTTSGLP